jgi:hypothetical protein
VPSVGRLSLMEYADEVPINLASLVLFDSVGFGSSRSDLFCHHIMIARAIGGSVLPFTTNFIPFEANYLVSPTHGRVDTFARESAEPHDPRVLVGQRNGGHIGIASL